MAPLRPGFLFDADNSSILPVDAASVSFTVAAVGALVSFEENEVAAVEVVLVALLVTVVESEADEYTLKKAWRSARAVSTKPLRTLAVITFTARRYLCVIRSRRQGGR